MFNTLHVLKEPSEWYTFDGPAGKRHVNITLVYDAAVRKNGFEWCVKMSWDICDHNLIEIKISYTPIINVCGVPQIWLTIGIDWGINSECIKGALLNDDIKDINLC